MSKTVNNALEILRLGSVPIGIFFAFLLGSNPVEQFSIITAFSVIIIAGLTGIESIFFSKTASEQSGYVGGREYQRQSGANNLALAITATLVYIFGWGFYAQLSVMSVLIIFLALSGSNHAYSAFKEGNASKKNLSRPIMAVILIIVLLYFVFNAISYPIH